MSELMNPRVPGLGLAPALASRDIHPHRRDAHLYDALTHDAPATRPTVRVAAPSTASAFDRMSRRLRGAVGRGAAEPTAQCRPSRPAARA
jgi:hypothetical protein